jgi:hypothetical protein
MLLRHRLLRSLREFMRLSSDLISRAPSALAGSAQVVEEDEELVHIRHGKHVLGDQDAFAILKPEAR